MTSADITPEMARSMQTKLQAMLRCLGPLRERMQKQNSRRMIPCTARSRRPMTRCSSFSSGRSGSEVLLRRMPLD